jgi:glycosyltransferase involved in cell wall biosynthesis
MDPAVGLYLDLHRVAREVSAVTGACLLVRRSVFAEAGGFDEALSVVGNDVDFCLRLARLGRRTIWTPAGTLVHHESLSRSGVSHLADEGRVWDRWADLLLTGDPYYNPNLAQDRVDCGLDWDRVAGRQDPITEADPASGVNLVGYICAEMGVGEATRGEAQALTDAGIPFVIIDHRQGNPARMADRTWTHRVAEEPIFATNILHINADVLPGALAQLPAGLREGRRNIGYWTWELPEFPRRWHASFGLVDEVWVPSTFVRDAIGAATSLPVHVVPHAVRVPQGPFVGREHFGLPLEPLQFLAMYDTHSVQQRKNPMGAVDAFWRAFGDDDESVSLVLKVNNADHREVDSLRALASERRNVHLITDVLSRSEMDSLLACSDAFVSLHRAEGFGLPIAEAMALGKPVIATGWSGNMDFMSAENAACVGYRLVTLERSFGPYDAGQTWAEPDLDDAAAWMRRLRDDPAHRAELGAAAARDIGAANGSRRIGAVISSRLGMGAQPGLPVP